jgi:hypothetical protein
MMMQNLLMCFDALWMQECINDLYETGFQNDSLALLFLENQNAEIAIKTANGLSKRESIKNVVTQGTVWGYNGQTLKARIQ